MNFSHNIQVSFGKYIWCGSGDGFKLNTGLQKDRLYRDQFCNMLYLHIKMNDELGDTTWIELIDHTGFLFGYAKPSNKQVIFFSRLKPTHIGSELEIRFVKPKILSAEEHEIVKKRLLRQPMETIFSRKITIPDIHQYEKNICQICLDDIVDAKYVSHCGHLFCMDCLLSHLKHTDKLYPMKEKCIRTVCCASQKIKSFDCPVCREVLYR